MMRPAIAPTTDALAAPSQYEGGVPCSVCGHRLQQPTTDQGQQPSAYPSEILPGFLYLGNYDNASRCELLKALDVTHILNVRSALCSHPASSLS